MAYRVKYKELVQVGNLSFLSTELGAFMASLIVKINQEHFTTPTTKNNKIKEINALKAVIFSREDVIVTVRFHCLFSLCMMPCWLDVILMCLFGEPISVYV